MILIVKRYLLNIGLEWLDMEIYIMSENETLNQLTLFSGDSLVSLTVMPGSEEAQKITVTSGRKCLELLQNSSQLGLLGKMFLESSRYFSTKRYLTWKIKGTKQSRLYYQLVPSTPRIGETDYLLWLTPNTIPIADRPTDSLEKKIAKRKESGRHTTPPGNLAEQVQYGYPVKDMKMWPTPRGGTEGVGLVGGSGAWEMLKEKTDSIQEAQAMGAGNGGKLNPEWVEWLMNFPPGWTDSEPLEMPLYRKLLNTLEKLFYKLMRRCSNETDRKVSRW